MGITRRKFGFTIVELIVVISVVGILAAIVIVSYGAWQRSVQVTAVKNDLNAASSMMEDIRNAPGSEGYPEFGDPDPDFTSSTDVYVGFVLISHTTYCIDGYSIPDPTVEYYIDSIAKDKGPQAGDCATRPSLDPPATPASVAVDSVTSSSATISWGSVAGATSYTLMCAYDGGFIYNPRQTTVAAGSGTITGAVSGFTASTPLYCRVKAINSKGASSWSETVPTTTSA